MMHKLSLLDAVCIKEKSKGRNVVVYGSIKDTHTLDTLFFNLGIVNVRYITDAETDGFDKELVDKKGSIFIWIYANPNDNRIHKTLDKYGYEYLEDYIYLCGAHFQTSLYSSTALDPNMGHGTISNNETGMRTFGKACVNSGIAVLGASLVDETFFHWKLWPQLLQERLERERKDIVIFPCGCYAYTTTQVYLKLIRDVIPNRPKIVIDYSCWENDCFYGEEIKGPFVVGFQKREMELLKNRVRAPFGYKYYIKESENGNVVPQKTSKIIVENIRRSYEVCKRNGLLYYCIIPPSATFQKSDMLKDQELKWAIDKQSRKILTIWEEIESELYSELTQYVMDGRFWMDNCPGCFYDQFHMYEAGNKVISNKIYTILHDERII